MKERNDGPYSSGVAYMMWMASLFNVHGLHRFYLGKPISGLLYLFTFGFGYIGTILDAIRMPALVAEENIKLQLTTPEPWMLGLLPPGSSTEDVRKQLLRAAAQSGGYLTVTQAVIATGKDFKEVEAILDDMMQSGYVDIGNHPKTGAVAYIFSELVA